MSDDAGSRKRVAENQGGSRHGDDRDDEDFVTTPQVASAEVMATRRIISVRKPAPAADAAPAATGGAAPSPFGSVLGSFGTATASVAPSPFAAFGKVPAAAPVAPSPFAAFGSAPAAPVAPSPFAAFGSAPAPVKPAGGFGSGLNFGIAPAAPKPTEPKKEETPFAAAPAPGGFNFGGAVKFDFGAAASSFSAAAANAAAKAQAAPEEGADGEEDPEAEVPISGGASSGAPLLAATDVKTGEEGDLALFETHNAKLFVFHADDKTWHERGAGSLKVSKKADGTVTRVVMRDGKMKKVLLNCNLDKESFRIAQKQEKMFSFSAPNEGVVGTYLVKITGPTGAAETKAFLAVAEKVIA